MMIQAKIIDFPERPEQGKSSEWYTPHVYIEAARTVMGMIDLDPASCEMANQTVKATRFYSAQENGLAQPWYGSIWLNPPYGSDTDGRNYIEMFTRRLLKEYATGHVTQAILLSTAKTCTSWFDSLWDYPICFVDHNILFNLPKEDQTSKYPHKSHIHGTIFVYLGPNEQKFIDTFSAFGRIARAVDTPRKPVSSPSLWEVSP